MMATAACSIAPADTLADVPNAVGRSKGSGLLMIGPRRPPPRLRAGHSS